MPVDIQSNLLILNWIISRTHSTNNLNYAYNNICKQIETIWRNFLLGNPQNRKNDNPNLASSGTTAQKIGHIWGFQNTKVS